MQSKQPDTDVQGTHINAPTQEAESADLPWEGATIAERIRFTIFCAVIFCTVSYTANIVDIYTFNKINAHKKIRRPHPVVDKLEELERFLNRK